MKIARNNFAVIGGAGFIGSHICEELYQRHAGKVVVIDNFSRGKFQNLKLEKARIDSTLVIERGDINDLTFLKLVLERYDIKGVFHLAASWLNECYDNPRRCLHNNVIGTFNVLEACKEMEVERLVFSSSASVYGDQPTEKPIKEDAPYLNKNLYGATKIAGEHLLRTFYYQYNLSCCALRYMNVYGPRMDMLGAYVGLIPKALKNIDNNKPIVIAGDGTQVFDFIYVTDVARANILMMGYDNFDFVNVGSGVGHTVNEVVNVLVELYGKSTDIIYDKSLMKPGAVTRRIGSIEKAFLYGFNSDVSLIEGLRRTIEWHRETK